ncbi:MAG: AI-2E family transporter [Balneolaceae bacterium]|nr:AI-2E family transporter [Balneolaceae bacterium]MBO6547635.1 AI-2E family transporter [Balneolaceae bacterium]MBO6648146.1 AI-2E family transporter [Balneolaceae bacterium]
MKNITLERVVRFAIGATALGVVGLILYNYSILVAYLVLAMILSYILDPVVNRLQRMGLNRTLGITLTLSAVILFVVYISTNVIPIFVAEMVELANSLSIENIQRIASNIEARLTSQYEFIPDNFLEDKVSAVIIELFDFGRLSTVLSDVVGVFTNIFSAVLVVPFAAFFFLKDGTKIRRDILTLIPNKYFETSLTLIDKIEKRLGLYFRSVLLQSILVAFTSWSTLSIAGLDNSLSVGISVGIANTIPYFGPIIGYLLSIIISIIETGDFSLVLVCMLAIFAVQMLDNLVFQPFLFSRSADMHPVAILFIILVGAETAGILGMLIAIPIATVIKITINQVSWSFNNYQVFRIEAPPPQPSPPQIT